MATTMSTVPKDMVRQINQLSPSLDMPKPITPGVHIALDYVTAGTFLLGSVFLARYSRRAAIASAVCGMGEAAGAAMTDAPGGIWRKIDLPTHRALDVLGATAVGILPIALWLPSGMVSRFFRMQGTMMSIVTLLTDYRKSAMRRRSRSGSKQRHTERGRR